LYQKTDRGGIRVKPTSQSTNVSPQKIKIKASNYDYIKLNKQAIQSVKVSPTNDYSNRQNLFKNSLIQNVILNKDLRANSQQEIRNLPGTYDYREPGMICFYKENNADHNLVGKSLR
jgi:hypothetical protein